MTKTEIRNMLDKEEKMAFGKHYATPFTMVPTTYLKWLWDTVKHSDLERFYPNLWKYLLSQYKEFTKNDIL